MSQMQRFLFLVILLMLASALIYGFDSSKKRSPKAVTRISPTITVQPSPIIMEITDSAQWDGYNSRNITIEGKEYHVLIADTPERQALGLMYITKLEGYDGMIFPFDDLSKKSFWNKNTITDLEVYWLKDSQVVGKELLPSIYKTGDPKTITSPDAVNSVVELLITK